MDGNLNEQYRKQGYLIVRGLFDAEFTAKLRIVCDEILEHWRRCNPETGAPGGDEQTCMRHLNHPAYFDGKPDAFRLLMDAVAHQGLLRLAEVILGEKPLFRCTSYFINPKTKHEDGNWHRDTQFIAKDEASERKMVLESRDSGSGVQIQVALAPSDDVEVVPGSHLRWDTPEEYAIRRADGGKHCRSNSMPGAVRAALQPGDAAIFNAVALHRGRYHSDKLRRTLMLTYTTGKNPRYDYFTQQPWFLEADYLAPLSAQTRNFFAPFVEAFQEKWREKSEAAV